MDIVVGSTNPVKVAAVEEALSSLNSTIRSVTVDSGVAEQPRSTAETIEGASNRAKRALAETDAEFGIGLEGGVDERADGLYLVMWAGATDGDRLEVGSGPSLRLPDPIAERVQSGEELGPALDDHLGTDCIARRAGAVGVFSRGLTNRREALAQAVACSFGPLTSEQY